MVSIQRDSQGSQFKIIRRPTVVPSFLPLDQFREHKNRGMLSVSLTWDIYLKQGMNS
jgi:hypothetical protein